MRVKINAAVGMRLGQHVYLQLEILERFFIADVKQVAAVAMRHQRAVRNAPGVRVLHRRLPAGKSFAVKQAGEAFLDLGGG